MSPSLRHERPTIGVLAGWQFYRTATNLSYLLPIYRGISKAARNLGCNLLLGCGMGPSASPTDPLKPAWPIPAPGQDFVPIGEWNTDGMIIAVPLHSNARSEYVQKLIKGGHPTIFIGSGENGPTIAADNRGGIFDAMQHLLQHGHREIAFIAGSQDDMQGDTGERLRAYQQFCESNHMDKDPRLVTYGQHIYSGGYFAMQQILSSGVKFTAVMASNDESALGAMEALTEAGLKVPDDVAVIGFDNRLEGSVQKPALTSIHVPLFDIGYHAVELLLQKMEENIPLPESSRIETRLVIRHSCGCGSGKWLTDEIDQIKASKSVDPEKQMSQLAEDISKIIMNQAHSLTKDECLYLCKRLVDAYRISLGSGDSATFKGTLLEVLQRTEEGDDDTHLWQGAISMLETGLGPGTAASGSLAKSIIDEARQVISAEMQQQHRRYMMRERWTSSRLSLLTAELLTALEEAQIYEILAKHLPGMGIHTALLALFEPDDNNPMDWSLGRNVVLPDQATVRFSSRDFPPSGFFNEKQPVQLTLIPIVDQSGQLGFMIFDTEHLDLYGAIVQQLGSAFNTVRLYRQATEGRRRAEEANRMKSRFLSTISHELRTPLNLIVGLSGVVLQEGEDGVSPIPESTQEDIKRIHAYAQHLGGLIGDVIDLATLDAGQFRLNRELVDVGDALQIVAESGRQLATDKGLSWRSDIPRTGPWFLGDRTRLRQVVLNLVNNAIKFTSRGEVDLSLTSDDRLVTISVSDTGLGIPPEEQDAIFDAFRRSERSIALGYPGLGLGLAICKTLVEMQDGTLTLTSTGIDGEGATFCVTLPVISPPPEQSLQIGDIQRREKKVLVLSTQPGTNKHLTRLLNQRGVKVQEALMGGHSGWQSNLDGAAPDLIILDVTVQSDLSWTTLKAIKDNQVTRGIPVLLYSSSGNGESLMSLDYLTKPVELDELTRVLDQHWVSAASDRPTRTILVVDDEPNTLELHARIVRSQSTTNRVLSASNGLEALHILQKEKVDLVLLDLQMPKMDGFGVLEAMRDNESTREIPVIVITGKTLSEDDMQRLNQGVAVVLRKGLFSTDETVAHIESALEQKRNLSEDTQRLVRMAMAYIHLHYPEPISRQAIARHINISDDYLTFCFRQEMGTTPIKYLQRYRVNQSKILLKNSPKTITEIAMDVGFSDSGYFSRIFHRETGMSPDQFRHS
jgi:signal transduction histidine kinase/DNA-binding LacI/PurR family transcriptional regulator/DNA-binding response OmpR family regulator